MARRRTTRLKFGKAEQLPSGKWRARYTWPPTSETRYNHKAPHTFDTRRDAEAWLKQEADAVELETWQPPAERYVEQQRQTITVSQLVDMWLAQSDFKESTRQSHRRKLDNRALAPSKRGFTSLADVPVSQVDRQRIRKWWAEVKETWPDSSSTNSVAYKRLHTAFQFAVDQLEIIDVNPVKIAGAGKAPRPESRDRNVISLAEAHALVDNAPDRLTAPIALLLWAGLRLGELLELRRGDLDGLTGSGGLTVRVRRNAQRVTSPESGKQVMVTMDTPKTTAGYRDIVLPQSVATLVRTHAREHMQPGANALVVTTQTGNRMLDTTFRSRWKPIAEAAGRPDITPHDCRRFFGTQLVNRVGISLEEARRLMGHETVEQLMEYQRAAAGYEQRAAAALEAMINAGRGNDNE